MYEDIYNQWLVKISLVNLNIHNCQLHFKKNESLVSSTSRRASPQSTNVSVFWKYICHRTITMLIKNFTYDGVIEYMLYIYMLRSIAQHRRGLQFNILKD